MSINIGKLNFSLAGIKILNNIDLEVGQGEFVGLIGGNGSGKSTLLKNIYRVYKPDSGVLYLNGMELTRMSFNTSAREMAVVSQDETVEFDYTILDIVLMGRYPYKKFFEHENDTDITIAINALRKIGMLEFKERSFFSLSGGEKQRVLIARALAQQTEIIILDEPTNHLDIKYRLEILDILKNSNLTVLAAIHDLNIAALYCDKLFVLKRGEVIASGTPEEILNNKNIFNYFEVKASVTKNLYTNKLQITYIPQSLNN